MKIITLFLNLSALIYSVTCQDTNLDLIFDTGKEYDQEVAVFTGSKFAVKLIGKSGTGYQWLTVEQDMEKTGASKILRFVNYTYDAPPVGTAGGSLVTNVNFDVIGTGNAKLNLFFARSWELNAKIASGNITSNDISKIISITSQGNASSFGLTNINISLLSILSMMFMSFFI